jgi:hypothetical protein
MSFFPGLEFAIQGSDLFGVVAVELLVVDLIGTLRSWNDTEDLEVHFGVISKAKVATSWFSQFVVLTRGKTLSNVTICPMPALEDKDRPLRAVCGISPSAKDVHAILALPS